MLEENAEERQKENDMVPARCASQIIMAKCMMVRGSIGIHGHDRPRTQIFFMLLSYSN